MTYEVIVEGFVLEVEVTNCENTPPWPGTWNSDWDFYGSRELEFVVLSGITYDANGARKVVPSYECFQVGQLYAKQIEVDLWRQIDSRTQRQRWAA